MEYIEISKVRKGDYVKRSPDAKTVYIRGVFVRGWSDGKGRYSLTDTDDYNREIFVKGGKKVYVGFTY